MDISTLVNYLNDFANVIPWDAILASGILSPLMVPVIKFVKAEKRYYKITVSFLRRYRDSYRPLLADYPNRQP
jgi:hypothetical protein